MSLASLDYSLHPKSHDFVWQDTAGPFRRITPAQARQYDEAGYFLLDSAFTPQEIAAVIAEIDPVETRQEAALAKSGQEHFIYKPGQITFTIHMVMRSAALRAFSRHRVFLDLCHDLMGPKARLYWDQAVYKKPGMAQDFPWHQDNGYTFTSPQQYLTCWVALTDATVENGCPWVVPGLHRVGTLAHRSTPYGHACLEGMPEGAVAVPAKAGDIVVFSSLTPHRTGPNLTGETRRSYILQYAPDGVIADDPFKGLVRADDPDRQYLLEP